MNARANNISWIASYNTTKSQIAIMILIKYYFSLRFPTLDILKRIQPNVNPIVLQQANPIQSVVSILNMIDMQLEYN